MYIYFNLHKLTRIVNNLCTLVTSGTRSIVSLLWINKLTVTDFTTHSLYRQITDFTTDKIVAASIYCPVSSVSWLGVSSWHW